MLPRFSKKIGQSDISKQVPGGQSVYNPEPEEEEVTKRDIRMIVAWLVFTLTLSGIALAYGMNVYFDGVDVFGFKAAGRTERVNTLIAAKEDVIKPGTINELILFDRQIKTAKSLGNSKQGYAALLDTLAQHIIQTVQFQSVSISLSGDEYTVQVEAFAQDLNAYLQQENHLAKSTNPLMSGLTIDQYTISRNEDNSSSVAFSFGMKVSVDEVMKSRNPQ